MLFDNSPKLHHTYLIIFFTASTSYHTTTAETWLPFAQLWYPARVIDFKFPQIREPGAQWCQWFSSSAKIGTNVDSTPLIPLYFVELLWHKGKRVWWSSWESLSPEPPVGPPSSKCTNQVIYVKGSKNNRRVGLKLMIYQNNKCMWRWTQGSE